MCMYCNPPSTPPIPLPTVFFSNATVASGCKYSAEAVEGEGLYVSYRTLRKGEMRLLCVSSQLSWAEAHSTLSLSPRLPFPRWAFRQRGTGGKWRRNRNRNRDQRLIDGRKGRTEMMVAFNRFRHSKCSITTRHVHATQRPWKRLCVIKRVNYAEVRPD